MSYVKSNLMPNEHVIARGQIHWWAYAPGVLRLAIGLGLVGWMSLPDSRDLGDLLRFAVIALGALIALEGAISVLRTWIYALTTELAITNKRVIVKWGFIRRSTIELVHSKVESINVVQSIVGRILGFGTIVVHGIGKALQPMHHIAAPLSFRRALYQND